MPLAFSLCSYAGPGVFGSAYRVMLRNDPHAPGSVDRALMEHMVEIRKETAEHLYSRFTSPVARYVKGSRPALEQAAGAACGRRRRHEARIAALVSFAAGLGARVADQDLDELRFGGTEEEIIHRGSDWCTDVARVACALLQVAGLPARLIHLADTARAYSGHVIVEVFRQGRWGAADSSTGVVYRHADGRPATTWELLQSPALVRAHCGPRAAYTSPGQFRRAAVSNYFVWDAGRYGFEVTGINAYYCAILKQAQAGWLGGLRWLHGEDRGRRRKVKVPRGGASQMSGQFAVSL